ncbi:hypothetical protein KM915_21095 [Cytobacillus oceanisediminis]|uniref:hypothetical protein n=1 Tax=Cytobacillus oceanisediminis TaxID=665099 RepID=UPI001C23D868|nr:hypothetical protein [Cytobacillus oceanisediminis]MBU8732549.1 hypothetical protein [Cytobacillus oceanisediminis]
MSKFTKKKNGFPIRYKHYVQRSVSDNTKRTIMYKKKNEHADKHLNHHMLTYENVNQTIIGSYIFKLIYDSGNNPEVYRSERIGLLNKIFQYAASNQAWYDLWKTFMMIEEHVYTNHGVIDHQVSTEKLDMFRLNLPYSKVIVGLKNERVPILETPPFYLTENALNYIENNKSVGRKKSREMFTIQTQTAEFSHYLAYSFGLYRESHMDLLSRNGLSNDVVASIQFPRKLTDTDTLIEFIQHNRHFTMNPNGVVIDCFNCGDIEQVILFEQEGYLLWKVIFKQKGVKLNQRGDLVEDGIGAEYCGYFSPSFFPRSNFSEHITHLEFETSVYDFVLECYADIVCGASLINKKFKRDIVNLSALEMQESHVNKEKEKMGLRFIPRKTHNNIQATTTTKEEYEREIKKYFISGHLRRLPDGHFPSKDAISHALEFGIELPENHTFVRPYETGEEKLRSHYVKKL